VQKTTEKWVLNLWDWADKNNIDSETLPRDKEQLLNPTSLDFYRKNLDNIPKEIGNLINLKELNLSQNNLKQLPQNICNLKNLEKFYLVLNNLSELPKNIGNLVNLTEIYFADNNLYKLPKSIEKLTKLIDINLDNNYITELTEGQIVWLNGIEKNGCFNPTQIITDKINEDAPVITNKEFIKYDDASWHYGGDYPKNLDTSCASTHIGVFVVWCVLNGLTNDEFNLEPLNKIADLKQRKYTPAQYLIEILDEKFTSDILSDKGNEFAKEYYETNKYIEEYLMLGDEYDTLYEVPNTWDTYKNIESFIKDAYQKFTYKKEN
jgi:Leucine-rich repeat (LRR) protein